MVGGNDLDSVKDTVVPQHIFFDAFNLWGYWFRRKNDFTLSDVFLWKVLDFVEGNILVWRADIDLAKSFFGAWPWGPLLNRGVQHPPNCKGDPEWLESPRLGAFSLDESLQCQTKCSRMVGWIFITLQHIQIDPEIDWGGSLKSAPVALK